MLLIMRDVIAEITVKNYCDIVRVRNGQITENNVRAVTFTAIVDTRARSLVINEDIFNQLGLSIEGKRLVSLGNNTKTKCKVTSPVDIHWKDREVTVNAVVLPESKPILGLIPLEFMDLMVDPVHQELVGVHGDEAELMAM